MERTGGGHSKEGVGGRAQLWVWCSANSAWSPKRGKQAIAHVDDRFCLQDDRPTDRKRTQEERRWQGSHGSVLSALFFSRRRARAVDFKPREWWRASHFSCARQLEHHHMVNQVQRTLCPGGQSGFDVLKSSKGRKRDAMNGLSGDWSHFGFWTVVVPSWMNVRHRFDHNNILLHASVSFH